MKAVSLALLLSGCLPTAYERKAPGVYPPSVSELNADSVHMFGVKQAFYLDPAHHWRPVLTTMPKNRPKE